MEENLSYEEPLDELVGNLTDTLKNLIYKYQKYIDMLYNNIPNITKDLKKINATACLETISFIISEQDKILILKGTDFINDIIILTKKKIDSLNKLVTDSKNIKYTVSMDAYNKIFAYVSKINMNDLKENYYCKGKPRITDLNKYVSNMLSSSTEKLGEVTEFSTSSIVMIIENTMTAIIDVFNGLKDISENSNTFVITYIITIHVINLYVMLIKLLSTIKMK